MPLQSSWRTALPEDWETGGFGLYVHWPYCVSKCPYCDFNSHVSESIDQNQWRDAYLQAISYYAQQTPGRTLSSIYFGGGTPSLMAPSLVAGIIDQAQKAWHFSNEIEITLEANPNSVESQNFHDLRLAGINRVSLGIQALNDTDLRRLGRMHSADEALAALEIARTTFDRFSFDLIYARQHQSLENWEQELKRALSFSADHMSLYQLTIEDGTVFGARAKAGKLPGLPGEDLAADMFEITQNVCKNNGLHAYEVSNHARAGMESRHNLIYWNAGDYIGIGPGAHGRLSLGKNRFATQTPLLPNTWLKTIAENKSGEDMRERLSGMDQALEYLIMGMRTTSGISVERLLAMDHKPLDPVTLTRLVDSGHLITNQGRVAATERGRPVLNMIIQALAPIN